MRTFLSCSPIHSLAKKIFGSQNLLGETVNLNIAGDLKVTAVALFILVIACINFMNLSSARSANRSREVGIWKVFGARKKLLVNQFINEYVLLAFLGVLLAVIHVWLLLPMFNTLTGKGLTFSFESIIILLKQL